MLKSSCLKNDDKKEIKQIIIVEINSIFIIRKTIRYYKKNKNFLQRKENFYKIFNIFFFIVFNYIKKEKKKRNINFKKW